MKQTIFSLVIILTIAACSDEMPVTPSDVETFSKQLIGQWELENVNITPVLSGKQMDITPSKEYGCNQLSTAFESKDVVNKFCIQLQDDVIKVNKYYTCLLAPEQLSWTIDIDQTADASVNWETGKGFIINEINEGEIQATYKLLFFNLDNNSPDGNPAPVSMANQLWLDVKYDAKESSGSFKLKLTKVP